ncbi:MAG: hypothetical protein HEP71_22060 [Roseivirga sp.]|nr:hypothetical protein [Roseivirga sp.]
MKNYLKLSFALLAMALFVRCSQEDFSPELPDQISSPQLTSSQDRIAARLGTGLSFAMRYPAVRQSLKESILERFDGDYNVLLAQIRNKEVVINRNGSTSKVTFGELIMEGIDAVKTDNNTNLGSTAGTMSFLDSASRFHPLLQIALPQLESLSAEDWRADLDELPLAIVPEKITEDKVPVMYPNGQTLTLSSLEEPSQLVMVISRNERVIALPKHTTLYESVNDPGLDCEGDPFLETGDNSYVMIDDYYEAQNDCTNPGNPGSGGGTGSETPPAGPVCERDSNPAKDELTRIKFTTIQAMREAADLWFGGDMEIKAVITYITAAGTPHTLTKMYFGKRTDFRNCGLINCDPKWVNMLAEIIVWTKTGFAQSMNYMFFEYDGTGTTTTTTVAIPVTINGVATTVNSTVTTVSSDKPLGESIVNYCDPTSGTGTMYNTGVLFFEVNQQ